MPRAILKTEERHRRIAADSHRVFGHPKRFTSPPRDRARQIKQQDSSQPLVQLPNNDRCLALRFRFFEAEKVNMAAFVAGDDKLQSIGSQLRVPSCGASRLRDRTLALWRGCFSALRKAANSGTHPQSRAGE